jgi:hypothetical protein
MGFTKQTQYTLIYDRDANRLAQYPRLVLQFREENRTIIKVMFYDPSGIRSISGYLHLDRYPQIYRDSGVIARGEAIGDHELRLVFDIYSEIFINGLPKTIHLVGEDVSNPLIPYCPITWNGIITCQAIQ